MLSLLYGLALKLLSPTAIVLVLLVSSMALRRHGKMRVRLQLAAIGILLICGNGPLGGSLVGQLERSHPGPDLLPTANAILILSGGVNPRVPPRPSVEVGEAGDRVLYGASLFRAGRAPRVICTGNVVPPGTRQRSTAAEMADLLSTLGVPSHAITIEGGSGNTHEHAVNLCPLLRGTDLQSVLLVTSAMHMPRALGTFRKVCPTIDFVPAPADYRTVDAAEQPWTEWLVRFVPTPANFVNFSDAAHEYLGMLYYRARGWL